LVASGSRKAGTRRSCSRSWRTLEHRYVAVPARALWRGDQVGARRRRGKFSTRRIEELLTPTHKWLRSRYVECARHRVTIKRRCADAHERGHSGASSWGGQGMFISTSTCDDIDCDVYVFTGHKPLRPKGIGALYGKYATCGYAHLSTAARNDP